MKYGTENNRSTVFHRLLGRFDSQRRIGIKFGEISTIISSANVETLEFLHNVLLNLCIDVDKKKYVTKIQPGLVTNCATQNTNAIRHQSTLINKILQWKNVSREAHAVRAPTSTPSNNSEEATSTSTNNLQNQSEMSPLDVVNSFASMGQHDKLLKLSFTLLSSTTQTNSSFDPSIANLGPVPFYVSTEEAVDYYNKLALKIGTKLERQVIDTIRSIGEVVILSERVNCNLPQYSSHSIRSDDVFEYFCENSILALLVDIVQANPLGIYDEDDDSQNIKNMIPAGDEFSGSNIPFSGIVGSAKIKAQVYWTVARLITGIRDTTALYFILSQNCINHLVLSIFPIENGRYTRLALDIMIPPYLQMMQTFAFHLSSNPDLLFPFFTSEVESDPSSINSTKRTKLTIFPLFSSIIGLLRSSIAHSDSYIHSSCISLTIGLLHLPNQCIQRWISTSGRRELGHLSDHICDLFIETYHHLVNLTTGSIVDVVRSNTTEAQLEELQHRIDLLNDIFATNIQSLNMILCELWLKKVIFQTLLNDMAPSNLGRCLLPVGVSDYDVIPVVEASAQVATFVLSRLLLYVNFGPFVRMITVGLFHPTSTRLLCSISNDALADSLSNDEFAFTMQLNSIILNTIPPNETQSNRFRHTLYNAIRGDFGHWRVITSLFLLESCIDCVYVDSTTLSAFDILPCAVPMTDSNEATNTKTVRPSSALEECLIKFMGLEYNNPKSIVPHIALESVSYFVIRWYHRLCSASLTNSNGTRLGQNVADIICLPYSSLLDGVQATKVYFFRKTMECKESMDANDAFLDLFESVVQSMYKSRHTAKKTRDGMTITQVFTYQPVHHLSQYHRINCEYLVRKDRGMAGTSNIDFARFYMRMSIHFRAVCNILLRYQQDVVTSLKSTGSSSSKTSSIQSAIPSPRFLDEAGSLAKVFGSLSSRPNPGSVLDLTGLTTFELFFESTVTKENKRRQNIQKKSLTPVVVLDATSMFIVHTITGHNGVKEQSHVAAATGTIQCWVSLVNIIAIAIDGGSCLHVAVRNEEVASTTTDYDDDNYYSNNGNTQSNTYIRNGNMILSFESSGTCQLVKQYLDRGRNLARQEETMNITKFLSDEMSASAITMS